MKIILILLQVPGTIALAVNDRTSSFGGEFCLGIYSINLSMYS